MFVAEVRAMKKEVTFLLGSLAMLLGVLVMSAAPAWSKPVSSAFGQVTNFDQYSGDTLVFMENNPAACAQGFWMRPTHPGFKDNLAELEKAIHSKARVKLTGNDEQRWPQTEDLRCQLQSVTVEPVSQLPKPQIKPVSAE